MPTDTTERGLERLICTALARPSLRPAFGSHRLTMVPGRICPVGAKAERLDEFDDEMDEADTIGWTSAARNE